MKRTFVDLHLCLNLKDDVAASRIVNKASALGYTLIGVSLSLETHRDENTRIRQICTSVGIDFVSRVDLRPRTRDELMNQLRKLRRKFEILCVSCANKEIARQAAKDRRVDLLSFPSLNFRERFFDRAEAELACQSFAALEIDMKPLLLLEGPARIRLLSTLRREVSAAEEFHVPVVVSSGVGSEMLLRKPREMAAFMSLLGLDETSALQAISDNAVAIVQRNREKLSPRFIAPGIRVIKEGKDC